MGKLQSFYKLNNGQSTVEYILLLVVITSIGITILNSDRFQEFLGEDSAFFSALRRKMEYSYRHGMDGLSSADTSTYNGVHESYFNNEEGKTRFFAPAEQYPEGL